MIRNLKALGLTAIAALAMSAMFASAASASPTEKGTFTAGETPSTHTATEIHGVQYGSAAENVFTAFAEGVTCTSGTYEGTDADGTATTIELTPTYSGCTTSGGLPVTVTHEGCKFTFGQPETFNDAEKRYTGLAGLSCAAGVAGVTIHVYSGAAHGFTLCTITVTKTTTENLSHIIYKNVTEGGKDHLTVQGTVSGLHAEETGLCGSHTDAAATLNTKVTVKAYKLNTGTVTHHDLWISDATTP